MEGVNPVPAEVNFNVVQSGMEEVGLVGDNFLTFFDENSSVVFKGVIDQNGTFLIDPSQFVNILLDHSHLPPAQHVENSTGMAVEMISIPPSCPAGEKASLNAKDSENNDSELQQRQAMLFQSEPVTSGLPLTFTHNSGNENGIAPVRKTPPPPLIPLFPESQQALQTGETRVEDVGMKKQRQKKGTPMKRPAVTIPGTFIGDEDNLPQSGREVSLCTVCLKTFQSYQQLRKHRTEHLNEKPHHCPDCPLQFNFEFNLKLHTMLHEAEKSGNLQCEACTAKFSRLASLKSHLRIHEKEENLVCNECGEEVSTLARLNEHMDEHRTRTQQCMVYRCKLCGKPFNSQALLRDHSKEHMAVRKELKVFARQKPRSKTKKTSDSSGWTPSKKPQKKRQICTVCAKGFDKPSQLDRHFRIHSGEKPFKCSYPDCNKSFNQKVTLESHVLACHQGLKPYKCHLCSLCFSQRGNLKSHIVKVHIPSGENERVFKCQECACVYRRLATLNNHIARVHAVTSTDPAVLAQNTLPALHGETLPLQSNVVTTETLNDSSVMVQPNSGAHLQAVIGEEQRSEPVAAVVQEVNCVYDDSQGASKRCLLKVKKVGPIKYHLCPMCPKSFRKPSDLIRHIRVHTLERPYVCGVCSKSFAVKSTLSTHMKTHESFKALSCNTCQKKFSVLSSLKSHERLHTGAKPFKCMQCGKSFRTSSQRRVHLKTHTRNALGLTGRRKLLRIGDAKSNVDLPDPLKITSDGLVPVPNRAIRNLVNGALMDQRTRPYRCTMHPSCNASFKKSSHLKQHQRSHTGERPYKCLQCHRDFISSGVLKNHIKTHEGVRAYSCKVCNFAFTTNGSLTRHMATHTEERLYVCPYCGKTFKTGIATRKHIRVHRDEIMPFHSSASEISHLGNGLPFVSQSHPTMSEANQYTEVFDNPGEVGLFENEFSDLNEVISRELPRVTTADRNPDQSKTRSTPVLLECQVTDNDQLNCLVHENSEIIHNADGTVTLQYTLPGCVSGGNIEPGNLELDLDNHETNFDASLFTLQHGESLDLQFLQDTQQHSNESANCLNELASYGIAQSTEPELAAITSLPVTIVKSELQKNSSASDAAQKSTVETSPVKPKICKPKHESSEVSKIREASRPISEQLYTELATLPYQRRPKIRPPSRQPGSSEKQNECSTCKTRFKKKSDLERHMRIHTGEKPYRCKLCGKSFRVKSTREAHMRTHEEKKKTVSCHVCNNLFSTKSSLRVHLRLHLDLKPYQCGYPNCSRSFRTSGHRKSHHLSHFKQKSRDLALAAANGEIAHSELVIQELPFSEPVHNQQVLPPVETIKEIKTTNQHQLGMTRLEVVDPNQGNEESIHVLNGNLQLQLNGLQFASLDLSSLQVDENFLQGVIFIPSTQGTTDMVNGSNNMVIGVIPGQELTPSDLITGKDVTLSLNLLGTPGLTPADQLTNQLAADNNVHQYIINNEMMSSSDITRHSSTVHVPQPASQDYILSTSSDLVCQTCSMIFLTKNQLQKHEKSHEPSAPTERPFRCSSCSRSFVHKSSFDSHVLAHSKEKKEFPCPLCAFNTQRQQNLKTHFIRAHGSHADSLKHQNDMGMLAVGEGTKAVAVSSPS